VDAVDLDKLSQLSPFELKNRLITLAASHAERVMLNAGRGNPNFLATAPRHAFFQLGLFAMAEAERCAADLPEGIAGLPTAEGIAARFETFAQTRRHVPGIAFLGAAVSYARDALGISDGAFLCELVQGVLGCHYPEPVRMLMHAEEVVRRYLLEELTGGSPLATGIDLFAVEGGTAGITYVFNSVRENKLLVPCLAT
jgi:aspartate 4-decarboxylase